MKYDPNKKYNWSEDEGYPKKINNEDLVCKDCSSVTEEVISCKLFPTIKPGKVLYGEECEAYEKQ